MKDNEFLFEEKLKELEKLVQELESGDVDLDKALDKYTKAMKLAKQCSEKLKNVEEKVAKILNEDGKLEDFSEK